jgi:hypothetical protein
MAERGRYISAESTIIAHPNAHSTSEQGGAVIEVELQGQAPEHRDFEQDHSHRLDSGRAR